MRMRYSITKLNQLDEVQEKMGTFYSDIDFDAVCLYEQCLDASRPWLCFWILHSLELLEEPIPSAVASE